MVSFSRWFAGCVAWCITLYLGFDFLWSAGHPILALIFFGVGVILLLVFAWGSMWNLLRFVTKR